MATTGYWRCLLQPSSWTRIGTPTTTLLRAPFSSTSATHAFRPAQKPPADSVRQGHIRLGKQFKMGRKKKRMVERGKPILAGERKAFRKRIVLSNNNALPVSLQTLSARTLASPDSAGRVFALSDVVIDQLRTVEAFKPTQPWELFRQPSLLLRPETVDVVQRMRDAAAAKDTLRLVISGERISGKSVLLLQAMASAFLNDWVVISIPEGAVQLRFL